MAAHSALSLERQLAAAEDWWREAGVDCLFADEPRSWLGEAREAAAPAQPVSGASPPPGSARKARPAPPPAPAIGGDPAGWPSDFAGFAPWWLAEPSLDLGGTGPRLAPLGQASPELMVLVPMPEPDDRAQLLEGRQGQLVAAMLAAMEVDASHTYRAAALPRHMAQPDWDGLAQAGLGAVLLHHLALVRPRRLLVLGHGILPLLGHGRAQSPASIKQTAIQGGDTSTMVPTLVGFAPDRLLENAKARAMLWRQWLEWTGMDR